MNKVKGIKKKKPAKKRGVNFLAIFD